LKTILKKIYKEFTILGLPDLFVTLTANDSWPELKDALKNSKTKASIHNPVLVADYFLKRLQLILDEIKKENGKIFKLTDMYVY
jgi:hypothetical protein